MKIDRFGDKYLVKKLPLCQDFFFKRNIQKQRQKIKKKSTPIGEKDLIWKTYEICKNSIFRV